jgi:hypothetical protein
MSLVGTMYDRNEPLAESTWNSVEIVRADPNGRVVVKSLLYPDLTRDCTVKKLIENYRRRLGNG